jgi:hypothetical protein
MVKGPKLISILTGIMLCGFISVNSQVLVESVAAIVGNEVV